MEIDGNAIGDRLLVGRKIGDDGVEGIVTKVFAELLQVGRLIFPHPLEAIHDKAEQLQVSVILLTDMLVGLEDVLCAECSPLSRFEWDHQEVRRTERRIRDKRNVGRTVEQDVIVESGKLAERIDE